MGDAEDPVLLPEHLDAGEESDDAEKPPIGFFGRRDAIRAPTVENTTAKMAGNPRKPKAGGSGSRRVRYRNTRAGAHRTVVRSH